MNSEFYLLNLWHSTTAIHSFRKCWNTHSTPPLAPLLSPAMTKRELPLPPRSLSMRLVQDILRETQHLDLGYNYEINIDPSATKAVVIREMEQVANDALAEKISTGRWGDIALVLRGFYAAYQGKFKATKPAEALQRLRDRQAVPGKPPVRPNPQIGRGPNRQTTSRPRGRG